MQGANLADTALVLSTNVVGEPTTVMFRKSDLALEDEKLFKLNGNEYVCLADLSLWIRLLSKGDAVYIAEPMSQFRIHANQLQQSERVAVRCVTERFLLVQEAHQLGLLAEPGYFGQAMMEVTHLLKKALADPRWSASSRQQLEETMREVTKASQRPR